MPPIATDSISKKRSLFVYHQTHYRSEELQTCLPLLAYETGLTHLILAAIHINDEPDKITINDHLVDDPHHSAIWDEVAILQENGIKIMGMLGGAAAGSFRRLDLQVGGVERAEQIFRAYYEPLKALIINHHLDGIDLNVEEVMTQEGILRLIRTLRKDFPAPFVITLAPMAPGLQGGRDLSLINYPQLEKEVGHLIDGYNVQFYNGWGDAASSQGYHTIISQGFPAHKINLGLLTNPSNGGSGFVQSQTIKSTIEDIIRHHPTFGGVSVWEYFNAGGDIEGSEPSQTPWDWITELRGMLDASPVPEVTWKEVKADDQLQAVKTKTQNAFRPFRVAVLTVSDTAATKGSEYDLSGPYLQSVISSYDSFENGPYAIVPDEQEAIRHQVLEWTKLEGDESVEWIITNGGTGWGSRDVTPQALEPILSPVPVLLAHLSTEFLSKTPRSILSRPVVGLCDRTLVCALPGSKKACKEGWEALTQGTMKGVLAHGFKLLRGGDGSDLHPPRESVKQPNASASNLEAGEHSCDGHHDHEVHHHHHHHHRKHDVTALSKDPSTLVSGRLRKSPFPMISLSEALDLVNEHSQPLPIATVPVSHLLRNHVIAEDIHSSVDLPSTRTTNVDGYAVIASSVPAGVYEVIQSKTPMPEMEKGKVYRVNTGGPLPPGADAVIMVEDTELVKSTAAGTEQEIRVLDGVKEGEGVRQKGSDAKEGDFVLRKGTVIGGAGGEIGLLGFVGKTEVQVYRKPIVAIMSTGNELVDLLSPAAFPEGTSNGWTGIVDTNRPSLRAAIEGFGYGVVDLGIAPDTMQKQVDLVRRGLEVADVIITTGGTSMGEADLIKPLIELEMGGKIHFGRVAMKPGKPTTFASVDQATGPPKLIFALPGNPASALVTFHLFTLPALRGLGGWPEDRRNLTTIQVVLEHDMALDSREEFHRAIISPCASVPGRLLARTTGGQRSSRVASLCGANGFVHLPMKVQGGPLKMEKGGVVNAVLIGEIHN